MARFSEQCQGVVAIDDKVLRRSFDQASSKAALHMVSARDCEQRMVLAQIATDAKPNEITAAPKLLKLLSLKGNNGILHDDVRTYLENPAVSVTIAKPKVHADHGRIETRTATVCGDRLAGRPSLARPGSHRQGRAHTRDKREFSSILKEALLSTTAGTPVEIWFQDEAPVGQKGTHAYVWAPIGSRPAMV